MHDFEKAIADRAFRWVMCAMEPLTTDELLPAICQDENSDNLVPLDGLDEDLVLEYCHNLLVVDPIRKVWVPSHLSVIEYFENHLWSQSQANGMVASVCLILLKNTVLYDREKRWGKVRRQGYSTSKEEIDQNDPLSAQEFRSIIMYARDHWMTHSERSAEMNPKDRLCTLLEEFLGLPRDSSSAYRYWVRMVGGHIFFRYFYASELLPPSLASFAYCAFGLSSVLPAWHDFNWVKYDDIAKMGCSYLELAAISGSVRTCRDLIKYGAKVNVQTRSIYGSALAAAAYGEEKEIIKLLIEKGADVNMQLSGDYGSALAVAAYMGQKEITELLIEKGVDVNMQLFRYYGSALAVAACKGQKEITELLIEKGADVNMQLSGYYGSALAAAAYMGQKEITELLIEKGADVNMQLSGNYGSALAAAAAAYRRRKKMVELLIEKGADANMQLSGNYGSALARAAYMGGKEITELLIEKGADVNMQLFGNYGSALAAAAYMGRKEIIELLIEKGADVNMQLQHGNYKSALDAAEKEGTDEIVEMLIRHGAKRAELENAIVEE